MNKFLVFHREENRQNRSLNKTDFFRLTVLAYNLLLWLGSTDGGYG